MCLSDLYDFTPDQREAIAKVESLRRMRDVTAEWRAHFSSMPAIADGSVPPPCAEAAVAGTHTGIAA